MLEWIRLWSMGGGQVRLAINQDCEEIVSVAMIGSMTYSPVIRLGKKAEYSLLKFELSPETSE